MTGGATWRKAPTHHHPAALHVCEACADRRFYDCSGECFFETCGERCELGPRPNLDV